MKTTNLAMESTIETYETLAAKNYMGHRVEINGQSYGWQTLRRMAEQYRNVRQLKTEASRIDEVTILYSAIDPSLKYKFNLNVKGGGK